jgi:hypothetical protein
MMVELNYPLMLDVIRTAGILVGIYYYISILRNAQKNRTIDMVFQRTQTRSVEYFQNINELSQMETGWNTPDEFYEKYNYEKTPELIAKRSNINSGLNAWGYLLREGLVDIDFVCRFNTPGWIMHWWKTNEPIIMQTRDHNNPDSNRDFEFLYNAVKKRYPNIDENLHRIQDIVVERQKSETKSNR